MAANLYKRVESFPRFHLQNHKNADEIDRAGDKFKHGMGQSDISAELNWFCLQQQHSSKKQFSQNKHGKQTLVFCLRRA